MTCRNCVRLSGALLISALLVAGCGGGATATPTPTPTPVPGAEATPPTAEATPAPVAPGATAELALPSFDLEALTGAIPGVDSYRTSTSVGGVKQYESVVVTKPVLSKAITIYDGANVATRVVIIGKEAWTADGANGAFQGVPSEMASTMLMAFDPALMLGAYASLDWAGSAANLGTEEKNGVQAHHVRIDSTSGLGAAAAMPAGAAIDIWVADAGYIVGWEMTGFPEDANFAIEVSGVDDPANKVERPS
jgi:hypothetical protein